METEREDAELKKNISQYGFMSLEAVPLETVMLHTSSSSCRKKQARALSRAIFSLLGPLRECTETNCEITLKKAKVWTCYSRVDLY